MEESEGGAEHADVGRRWVRRVHRERGRLEAMNPVGCVNWENQGKIHPHGMQVWAQEGAVPESDDIEDQFHLHNFNRCHPRAYEIPFFK